MLSVVLLRAASGVGMALQPVVDGGICRERRHPLKQLEPRKSEARKPLTKLAIARTACSV